MAATYHGFVPAADHPRIQGLDNADPYEYSRGVTSMEFIQPWLQAWSAKLEVPFYGVTSAGTKQENIYALRDEGAPTSEIVAKAQAILEALSEEERAQVSNSLDGENWRKWSNPEIIFHNVGVRLERLDSGKSDLVLDLLKVSLSEVGYAKVQGALKTNKFLGEICHSRGILNEKSYFFAVYGTPSETEPWGYSVSGHHLCLNVTVVEKQMTIGPCFVGAEPNIIDHGPDAGTVLCTKEADIGLKLMQSLPDALQTRAQVYKQMHDPAMPEGRWHPADQRHMAGMFQDNRVIPYEGILATEMSEEQRSLLLAAVEAFLELLPAKPLEARLGEIRDHLSHTYFSWIGGFGPDDPFYYRIQSPVVLVEFDHHSGVFLTNQEPAKYHIHTLQRLPNGNDYGRELIRLWRQAKA